MSKINIDRIVKEIKTRSTSLTPIIEAICNSMDAIESNQKDGYIEIVIKRDSQPSLDLETEKIKSDIIGIDVIDNGVGFTSQNRDSFDTFRSGYKSKKGGKGFGRFMYLKYFRKVTIESTYKDESGIFFYRSFSFGHDNEIIENEVTNEITVVEKQATGSTVHLSSIISKDLDKGIDVIARKLVERLLAFFAIGNEYTPKIVIREEDNSESITLNDYVNSNSNICKIGETRKITVNGKNKDYDFFVKVYKVYYSAITNKICLTANMREVTDAPLHNFVPEFKETMIECGKNIQKNFMVKVYVQGDYLDENVTAERDAFLFGKEDETIFDLSERDIYRKAAAIAKEYFSEDIEKRYSEKKKQVEHYVSYTAPWNKSLLKDVDMENIPIDISDFDLEMMFQKIKFKKEQNARIAINELLNKSEDEENDNTESSFSEDVNNILSLVTENQRNDLAHYICHRKKIIELFDELRKRMENGKPHKECEMHNLFFPMILNDRETEYEDTNLWLLDERFNFTKYIASDKVISKVDHKEPDLALFYEEGKFYRNGENTITSPIAIVEFKRPKRVNYPDDENPINQALRYAGKILSGKYEMPDGLEKIDVDSYRTPVYIYIICDIVEKINEFAHFAGLSISPDGEGFFGYMKDYNAYVEIKSFKKVISDAKMRNQIFFKKLGLV